MGEAIIARRGGGAKKLNITIGSGTLDGIDEKFIYKTDTGGVMQKYDHTGNLIFSMNHELGSSWVGGSYSKKGCIFALLNSSQAKIYTDNGTLIKDVSLIYIHTSDNKSKPGFNGDKIIYQQTVGTSLTTTRLLNIHGTLLDTMSDVTPYGIMQFFMNFNETMLTRAFVQSSGVSAGPKLFVRKDDVAINQLVEDGSMITCLKAFYI